MADNEAKSAEQPIIIKKIVKGGHGHHGGAWKVAYADFVTAMMAFFIVMWILSAGQDKKEEIAAYFNDPGAFSFMTGKRTIPIDVGLLPKPGKTPGDQIGEGESGAEVIVRSASDKEIYEALHRKAVNDSTKAAERVLETGAVLEDFVNIIPTERPELADVSENIDFQLRDEGLRIELIESTENTFFQVGSSKLRPEVKEILEILASEIGRLPNFLEIEGHTDARGYGGRKDYTNWELSSDRANAARRAMVRGGLWDGQVVRVAGYADKFPRYPDNPFDPKNRRISILIKHLAVADLEFTEEDIPNDQNSEPDNP